MFAFVHHINSAYRNPDHNAEKCVGPGRPGSRHMFGDAVDLQNKSRTLSEWKYLIDMADVAHADFVERNKKTGLPIPPCNLGCAHADWREHPGGYVPAQSPSASEAQAERISPSVLAGAIQRLDSDAVKTRMNAFGVLDHWIRQNRNSPKTAAGNVQRLLTRLLRREYMADAALPKDVRQDEYNEYLENLIQTVAAFTEPAVIPVLLYPGIIETGDVAVQGVAKFGDLAVGRVADSYTNTDNDSVKVSLVMVLSSMLDNKLLKRDQNIVTAHRIFLDAEKSRYPPLNLAGRIGLAHFDKNKNTLR
jgi:hypothetical protein